MRIRMDRTRMAMDGNVYSYDLVVPVGEVARARISYFIVRDGQEYVTLEDATRPEELNKLPRGIERYRKFMDHSKACRQWAGDMIRRYFPELVGIDLNQRHPSWLLDGLVPLDVELSHHSIEANV
jgi:hypothetical protein